MDGHRESDWDLDCYGDDAGRPRRRRERGRLLAERGHPVPGRRRRGALRLLARTGRRSRSASRRRREPHQVWVHDLESGESRKLTDLGRVEGGVEPALHRVRELRRRVDPGLPLHSRQGDGPFPVVVTIHGGPEAQWQPWYSARLRRVHAAPRLARLRGRGAERPRLERLREALRALDDVEKRLDSVADLASLHAWLAARPEIDGSRQVVYGRSYGGYMVLAALAFQPELWAAGLECVGISSLRTFLENTSEYRRARARARVRLALRSASCSTASRRGAGSTRSARRSSSSTAATTRACPSASRRRSTRELVGRGVRCELVIYEDEGHQIEKLPNRIDCFERMVAFLDEVLPASAPDTMAPAWRLGRVVRQRPAKPFTAVRIR